LKWIHFGIVKKSLALRIDDFQTVISPCQLAGVNYVEIKWM